VISLDIGSAYPNERMPKDDPSKLLFMVAPIIADILVDIDPSYKAFLRPNGSIIVELDQALYGCIESAVLWYKEPSTFLGSIGFTFNPYDRCFLNKTHLDGQTTIAVYVDELLITSSTQAQAEAIVDALRDEFKELKVTTGTVHNYLGMVLDFSDPPYVSINQIGMIEDIIRKARESHTLKIPTASPKSRPRGTCSRYHPTALHSLRRPRLTSTHYSQVLTSSEAELDQTSCTTYPPV
jgi:Reverse transcriptase (RNA-dependent DNA polymerase)